MMRANAKRIDTEPVKIGFCRRQIETVAFAEQFTVHQSPSLPPMRPEPNGELRDLRD